MQSYWVDARGYEHAYAWNKFYRRTLFDNVQYPEGQVFEDVPTLYQLLRHAHTVHTTEAGRYHYTSNPKGITQQADGEDLGVLLKTHVDILTADTLSNDCRGLGEYYRHVLNIQLSVYDLTADDRDLILPVRPYWGSVKPEALHLLGLPRPCRVHRRYYQLTTKHAK